MNPKLNISSNVFNSVYMPYLKDDTRVQIFFGGSSSGKSYFLAQRLVIDMLQGDHNYLVVRQVANTLKRSVFNEVCKAISFFKVGNMFSINKSDLIITCRLNGMQVLFSGLDNAEKIKSITPSKGVISDIWVEEATETDYKSIKQLEKRLRGKSKVKKRMVLSFNPIYKTHWLFQEYFSGWEDDKNTLKKDGLTILKTTYRDNDFLADDDKEAMENEKDPYFKDVYCDGNWGVMGAIIFKNWKVKSLSDIEECFENFYCGCDFGYSCDPAAIVKCGYSRAEGTLYVFKAEYLHGATNDLLSAFINKTCGEGEVVRCDSAEPKSIAELRNYGIIAVPVQKGKGSINFGIQWLQQQRIVIDAKCADAIDEFSKYKWQEDKSGTPIPKPIDKFNHIIDAIRYATSEIMGQTSDIIGFNNAKYRKRRHTGKIHEYGSM